MIETDVLVVGAGPGGYVCAIKLGQLGKKTTLVDFDRLGGECLLYGCIPSKALIQSADKAYKAKTAVGAIGAEGYGLDWSKVAAWKSSVVEGLVRGISGLEKGNGVDVKNGRVRFTGPHAAVIESPSGTEEINFERAVIATGTRPVQIPGFEFDGKAVITSKEALDWTEPPRRLLVIGAGVIGLEIGTFAAKLGSQVTVIEATDRILPGVDQDLTLPVKRKMDKLGMTLLLNSKAAGLERSNGALSVSISGGDGEKAVEADVVLVSAGRFPVTKDLGLAAAGVKTDPKGHVAVDARMKTSSPSVYAIGDVVGPPYLAHKASREGIVAALDIAGKTGHERGVVPWAIFTDQEVSFVGETEAEAKARGVAVVVGRFPFAASGRAMAVRDTDGFVKVIADKESGRILGCGIAGPSASDLIGEACLAVKLGATVEQAASTIHPHPTLSEAFQEACEACMGQAIHILAPASARR